jgi:cytochrome c
MKTSLISLGAVIFALGLAGAASADDKAAQAEMKKSGCMNCHSLDKKKVGPSLKEISASHKGKADAAAELYTHLTTNPKVMVDGKEEAHESLKTKDDAQIKNVIQYILSR